MDNYTIRGLREEAAAAWRPIEYRYLQRPHICC